ncbi:hypothetical protein OC845_000122 [Tilletia horrida]|nr:hypothetical protein OC845_000122 [Tilletia horrida]
MPTTRSRQKQSSSAHNDAKLVAGSAAVRPRKTSRSKPKVLAEPGTSSDAPDTVDSDAPSAPESIESPTIVLNSDLPSDMASSSMMFSSDPPLDSMLPSSDPGHVDMEQQDVEEHDALTRPPSYEQDISKLKSVLQSRNAEILATRKLLRRFAQSLSKTVTAESAPPGTFGKVARTSGIFGRFSVGPSASREADGSLLPALDESTTTAFDCTNGSALLPAGETSSYLKLTDDVDDLCVLLSEATQRYDFLRLEDNLQKQRLQKELDSLKARYGRVSSPKSPSSSPSSAHDKALESLKKQIEEMRSNSKVLAEEYAQKNRSQQEQIDELISTLEEQDQELDAIKHKAQATESQLMSSKEQHDKLIEEERAASASILQALTVEMDKLKMQNSRLQEEKRLAEKASEVSAEEAATHKKEKGALNSRIEEMERLIQESEECRDQLKSLKDQAVQAKEVESEQSQQEVEQLRKELKEVKAAEQQQVDQHAQELQEQISRVSTLQEEVDKKDKELAVIQEQLADKDGIVHTIRDESEKMSQKLLELEDERDKLHERLAELEGQVSEHSEASVSAQAKVDQLQNNVKELEQLLEKNTVRNAEVDDLKAELAILQLEIAATKARAVEAVSAELSETHAEEKAKLYARIQEVEGQLRVAEERAQQLDTLENQLREERARHQQRAEKLQKELEEAKQKEKQQLCEQTERLQDAISRCSSLEAEMKRKEADLTAMRTQLVVDNELLQETNDEVGRIAERLEAVKIERDSLRDQMSHMEEALAQSRASSESSRAELSLLQKHVNQLEEQLAKLKQEGDRAEDLHAQVAQLEEELSRKVEEIEENDTKTLAFMKERKRLEIRVKKLQDKVEQLSKPPASPRSDEVRSVATVSPVGSTGERLRSATTVSPVTSGGEQVRSAATVSPIGSTGERVRSAPTVSPVTSTSERIRSPLAVSNAVNVPMMKEENFNRPTRPALAAAAPTQFATSSHSQREAKPPTPWSVAVALTSNLASRQASDGLKRARSTSGTVAVAASTQRSTQARSVERSRKRSSPDDVAEAARVKGDGASSASAPITRPVYVPSPRKSGFVPQRRSKANLAAEGRDSVGSAAPSPSVPASRVPSSQHQPVASHQNGAPARREPTLSKKPSHSYLSATKSSSSHLATKPSQNEMSAAERLATRLRPASGMRIRSGTGPTSGAGGGNGVSAQLAEARARREMLQLSDY